MLHEGSKLARLDWVRTYLAIGPKPDDQLDWQTLRTGKVTLIIDLNASPAEKRMARTLGIRHRGLRVEDPLSRPEDLMPLFTRVRQWIDKERRAGGRVYLHCTAGQQRSPTFAMAYLMANGTSRTNAERTVKGTRLGVWAGPSNIDRWKKSLELLAARTFQSFDH